MLVTTSVAQYVPVSTYVCIGFCILSVWSVWSLNAQAQVDMPYASVLWSVNCTVGSTIIAGLGLMVNLATGWLYTLIILGIVWLAVQPLSEVTVNDTVYTPALV